MTLPESAVSGTENSEEAFTSRLQAYRARNTEESTVLNYFDFREIHPVTLDAAVGDGGDASFKRICDAIGAPRNYGPPAEVAAARAAALKAKEDAQADAMRKAKAEAEAKEAALDAEKQAEWSAKRDEIQKQEEVALAQAALPLRNFLMSNVMPTLTEGLLEVCKTRPDDPVDFLAEYLFRKNPQIS